MRTGISNRERFRRDTWVSGELTVAEERNDSIMLMLGWKERWSGAMGSDEFKEGEAEIERGRKRFKRKSD